jgi:membrane-associated phospholipid phosphatase
MRMVPIIVIASLFLLSFIMIVLEARGLATTLKLTMKGDVKRETRLLAQYGQLVWTFLTALLIWQLDSRWWKIGWALWTAVIGTTTFAFFIKRLSGRIRPDRENAGKFTGPSFGHQNYRESFPSSHSASAIAYSVVMAAAYPHAAVTFWTLGIICAVLRYIMDAHWPSDVLAGIALGYLGGFLAVNTFMTH